MRSDVAFLFLMILGLIVVNSSVLIAVSEVSGNSITGVLKEEERPNQLFDITFEIDDSLILNINELVTRVTFESFGTVPTPVNLTYIIVDEMGKTLHVEKDYLTVETEKIFTKKFEGLDLDYGKYAIYLKTLYNVDVEDDFEYTLILTTLYNGDVEDEFRQKFVVKNLDYSWMVWSSGILNFILIFVLIYVLRRKF